MELIFTIQNNNMLQKPEQSLKNAYKCCHSFSWRVLLLSFCTILLHAKVAGSVEPTTKGIATPSTETNNAVLRRNIAVASGRAVTILCKTSKRSHTYFYDVVNKQRREPLNIDNESLKPYAVLVLHRVLNASTYLCFRNETLLSETILTIDNLTWSGVRIEMGEQDDAALTCKHEENQRVYFQDNHKEKFTTDIVSIDSRTSILLIRNASLQFSNFECKYLDNSSIDETGLLVGTPPSPVENFTCRGQNYRSLICEFPDTPNSITPTYILTYFGAFHKDRNVCELKAALGKHILVMNITESSNCSYTPSVKFYKFNLFAQNVLGSYSKNLSINNNECVIPPKLEINIVDITSNSVSLNWDDAQKRYYALGLVYDIHVKAIGMEEYSATIPCRKLNCSILLTNLTYANWNYELIVKARVDTNWSKWNEPTVVNFKTAARTPDRAPKTIVGGFYIHYDSPQKEISLYWEELAPHEENGPRFHYSVDELDMNGKVLNSKRTNETSVAFFWIDESRVYEVRAVNILGPSQAVSKIRVNVPKTKIQPQRIEQLLDSKRTLTLKWKPPPDFQLHPPINYTVFWCQEKLLSPKKCKDSIHFQVVDSTTTEYHMDSEDRSLIMAVAANYRSWSTGLHWKTCFNALDGSLETVKPEVIFSSARSIAINWHLENTCTNAFEGYSITYCEVADEKQQNCISENETRQLKISEMQNYTLVELNPYSWYSITMALYDKTGRRSQPSELIFCRTKEAAPEPPTTLRYANKTSNSVNIFWNAPTVTNGKLTKYTVWYNVWRNSKNYTTAIDIPVTNLPADSSRTNVSYKLEGLSSYSEYEVWVTAWTTEESNKHESFKFKTLVGRPSAPLDIKLNRIGDNYILNWSDPEMLSGPVQLYELKFFEGDKSKVAFVQRDSNKAHQCRLKYPGCTDGAQKLEIRAINVVPENELDTNAFPIKANTGQRRRRHSMPAISTSAINIQTTDSSGKNKNDATLNDIVFDQSDDAFVDKNQIHEGLECDEFIRMDYQIPTGFRLLKSAPGSSDLHSCETFPIEILMASLIFVGMFIASMSKSYNLYRFRNGIGVKLPDPIEEMISNKVESLPDNRLDNDSSDRSTELDTSEKLKESANLLKYGVAIRPSSSECGVPCVGGDDSVRRSISCENVDDKYRYMLKDEFKSTESASTLNDTSCSSSSSHQHTPSQCGNARIQVATRNDGYVGIQQLTDITNHPNNVGSNVSSNSQYTVLQASEPNRALEAASAEGGVGCNVGICLADGNTIPPTANGLTNTAPTTDAAAAAVTTNTAIFSNYLPHNFLQAKNTQTQPNLFPNSALATGNYVLPDALPKIAAAHIAPIKEDNEQVQKPLQQQMIPSVSYGYVTSDFWSMK